MLVEAGGQIFAVDSDDISTTIDSHKDQINLFREDNCIEYEGRIFRLIDLYSFLFQNGQPQKIEKNTKEVIVVSRKYDIALLVDRVISHQKVVVKDFSNGYQPLRNIKGVNGYTILGNEDIVLIMDMKKIAE